MTAFFWGSFIHQRRNCPFFLGLGLTTIFAWTAGAASFPAGFAGDAQHTAVYDAVPQPLNTIRWTTSINLNNTGAYGHYGAPLVTASNTVIVPVKTATGFQISAFESATGRAKYTLATDYIMPPYGTNGWFPVYQPALANPPSGQRLYYPGAGGTVYYVENVDSDTPSAPVQQCFYTNLAAYAANAGGTNGYTNTVFINTPITAGPDGTVYFGFRVQQIPPAPLNTTNDGFARLDSAGDSVYVLAGTAASDPVTYRDSHNCAPALSNDGATLYVAVKSGITSRSYLLGLDSVTLSTKYKVKLLDPRSGLNATVLDIGTASPLVGPDGDVYFGIMANPGNGSRGFMLHYTANLQTNKPPGAFGWDNTAAIVPTNMVPSYTGPSSYLLFSKYNNYANAGDGDGINRLALLDPNVTQIDPHSSADGLAEMREVQTVIGFTPDAEYLGTNYPYAVREWCINTAGVSPAKNSVYAPSEDGHLYRWDLVANSLSEAVKLTAGIGEPYVPTVIGPDGTVFTLNGGTMFAVGALTNLGIAIVSSAPDLRYCLTNQPVTFTAIVTNRDTGGPAPAGTVTFEDQTWHGTIPITNILASGVLLTNGVAMVTTNLTADTNNFGNHLIAVKYSGGGIFPPATASCAQKVHSRGTSASVTSAQIGSSNTVVFTTTVSSNPPGGGTPSGQVTFWDYSTVLAQRPLVNGLVKYTNSNYLPGTHTITATYASDTMFAAGSGQIVPTAPTLTATMAAGTVQVAFSNSIGAPFTVLSTSDISTPVSDSIVLGLAIEISPGHFQFSDTAAQLQSQRFLRVRSP
jgi:hypothetical protein